MAGVEESQIVLYGRSLGGGVMVQVAADDGARGLILESTFTSLPDVARDKLPLGPAASLMRNRFASIDRIAEYQGPLLMAHGDDDNVIPHAMGEELFMAANQPKQWLLAPTAGHNWTPTLEYTVAVDQFVARLPVAPGVSRGGNPLPASAPPKAPL